MLAEIIGSIAGLPWPTYALTAASKNADSDVEKKQSKGAVTLHTYILLVHTYICTCVRMCVCTSRVVHP